jgi:hypothetical protein
MSNQQPKSQFQQSSNDQTIAKVQEIQGKVQQLTLDKSKELQQKASRTFQYLTIMIWITFAIGLLLIAASLVLSVFKQQTLTVLGMGGLGVADFVALFFYKPMDRLQEADKDYVEQLIILKSWALSVNLDLLAMDVNDPKTVIAASKDIRTAATWSAHTIQDFLQSMQASQAAAQKPSTPLTRPEAPTQEPQKSS